MDREIWRGCPVIGEGVWGRVYDLGDGTVLKRARESGGIGSGRDKIQHEIAMMAALAPVMDGASFAVPRVVGWGEFPADADGFSLWLRVTKLEGRAYDDADFTGFPAMRRRIMAQGMVRALAEFQARAARADMVLPDSDLWAAMAAMGPDADDARRLQAVRDWCGWVADRRVLHGDFNITNILFDEADRVCGVLDFAEMTRGAAEDDLSSLTTAQPDLRADMVVDYERETGWRVDNAALRAAEARQDLLSLFIARYRRGDAQEAAISAAALDARLAGAV